MNKYINYFKNSEKRTACRRLGAEVEHLILKPDYTWVDYPTVERILERMAEKGWERHYTDGRLLGLDLDGMHITLEPGSQFELSLDPKATIEQLEESYKTAMRDAVEAIEGEGLKIYALAYQPFTKKDDILIIPKKRYEYMNEYFKDKGRLAHNMMRASASCQFAVDYESEEEFVMIYQTINRIGPYLSLIFDNTPYVEGALYEDHLFRTTIWQNCDDQRCGLLNNGLEETFGYETYADHILNFEPILGIKDGVAYPTYTKKTKEVVATPYDRADWEHYLSMGFFDVRAKSYLEIRMIDSVPYPYNFAAVALLKGIIYSEALGSLAEELKDVDREELLEKTRLIMKEGYDAPGVRAFNQRLLCLAHQGLPEDERHYLDPIRPMIEKGYSFKDHLLQLEAEEGIDGMMKEVEVTLEKLS